MKSDSDRLVRSAVGRVATREWRENVELSYGVRGADQAMVEIGERLGEAKADLTKIVKMFPPYPRDSDERVELLNSYRSLRAQIDRLTFPPDNESAAQIMNGSDLLPVDYQGFAVVPGEEGLALMEPAAPLNELEDDELVPLIDDLTRAEAILADRRLTLQKTLSGGDGSESDASLYDEMSLRVGKRIGEVAFSLGRQETGMHVDLLYIDWQE
ncbi:MAG TPA: hypothetical protein ENN66_04120 [Proteobacteria bacterium]|nr:hypothetical protein [Pseudomonadota bacterium]